MADRQNLVVVADADADHLRRALLDELTHARGWETVPLETAGARHLSVWRGAEGALVVSLGAAWDAPERELARALSRRCGTAAAAYLLDEAGEREALEVFADDAPVGAWSMNEAAGEWEVTQGGRRIFHHEGGLDGAAEAAFAAARRRAFGAVPPGAWAEAGAWGDPASASGPPLFEVSFQGDGVASVVTQVEAALERRLEPLLKVLGFARAKAEPRPLEAAVAYERPVGTNRLRVQYGFGRTEVHDIVQRFEYVQRSKASGGWIAPHVDIGRGQAEVFQPHRSPEHLDRACRFLAASLARGAASLAELVPELAGEIRAASESEPWRRASAEHDDLWRTRLVGRQLDAGGRRGRIVFKGANLVVVESEDGERFTFKVDTSALPDSDAVTVAGLWEPSGGGVRARTLQIGDRALHFDEEGRPKPDEGSA